MNTGGGVIAIFWICVLGFLCPVLAVCVAFALAIGVVGGTWSFNQNPRKNPAEIAKEANLIIQGIFALIVLFFIVGIVATLTWSI